MHSCLLNLYELNKNQTKKNKEAAPCQRFQVHNQLTAPKHYATASNCVRALILSERSQALPV